MDQGEDLGGKDVYVEPPDLDGTTEGDMKFLGAFLGSNDQFLLGLDAAYGVSVVSPKSDPDGERAISVLNGVRAPNPRICFSKGRTGYMYDGMKGASVFHLVVFGSDLQGPVRRHISTFSKSLLGPEGFYDQFGGAERFNVVLVIKALPFEKENLLGGDEFAALRAVATVLYDDRAPDEDAHYWYGVNHARGAVVVVRPDLWVGTSAWPEESRKLGDYFGSFLIPVGVEKECNGNWVKVNRGQQHVDGEDVDLRDKKVRYDEITNKYEADKLGSSIGVKVEEVQT